jgi:hypothetical protein
MCVCSRRPVCVPAAAQGRYGGGEGCAQAAGGLHPALRPSVSAWWVLVVLMGGGLVGASCFGGCYAGRMPQQAKHQHASCCLSQPMTCVCVSGLPASVLASPPPPRPCLLLPPSVQNSVHKQLPSLPHRLSPVQHPGRQQRKPAQDSGGVCQGGCWWLGGCGRFGGCCWLPIGAVCGRGSVRALLRAMHGLLRRRNAGLVLPL